MPESISQNCTHQSIDSSHSWIIRVKNIVCTYLFCDFDAILQNHDLLLSTTKSVKPKQNLFKAILTVDVTWEMNFKNLFVCTPKDLRMTNDAVNCISPCGNSASIRAHVFMRPLVRNCHHISITRDLIYFYVRRFRYGAGLESNRIIAPKAAGQEWRNSISASILPNLIIVITFKILDILHNSFVSSITTPALCKRLR